MPTKLKVNDVLESIGREMSRRNIQEKTTATSNNEPKS
jgi:hypothetical protein